MGVKASDLSIKALRPRDREYELGVIGHRGLIVRVHPSGSRSFILRYRQDGILKRVALQAVALADARAEWDALVGSVKRGADPAEQAKQGKAIKQLKRQEQRAAPTVAELAADFIRLHSKKNKRSWRADELMLEGLVVPEWGRMKAKDIKRRDVIDLIDRVAEKTPVRANRLLAVVRKMFNWAIERDTLEVSPCAGVKAQAKETSRDRVLDDNELRLFWFGLPESGVPADTQAALKLQLLLACRIGEIVGAKWSEINLKKGEWLIPKERAKNKRECLLPLSESALVIIRSLDDTGAHLFPRSGKGGHLRTDVATHELGHGTFEITERFTSHDLRRTAATNLAKLGTSRVVLDAILNHKDKTVGATYDRHDYHREKRAALESWAAHLDEIVAGKRSRKVVPIKRAGKAALPSV